MYIYIYIYMYLDDQVICFFLVVFFSPRIPDKHNELGKNLRGHKIFSSLRGPNPPDAQLMCALTSLSSSLTGQASFLLSWSLSFSFKEVTFVKLLSPNTTVKNQVFVELCSSQPSMGGFCAKHVTLFLCNPRLPKCSSHWATRCTQLVLFLAPTEGPA